MKKTVYLLVLLMAGSCEGDKNSPVTNTDEITLSTQLFDTGPTGYEVFGYSFELGKKISNLDKSQVADVIPQQVLHIDGSVIGAQLSAGGNNPYGFYKNRDFATLEEATNFYDSYHDAVDGPWESLTDTLAPFQVYTFRTFRDNYVKFMVTGVNIVSASSPENSYVRIRIQYYIQQDGSAVFDE